MSYSVSEIFKAIRKADNVGIRPAKVLLDESKISLSSRKENKDKTNDVIAVQVFGCPLESSDGFVVIPGNGQMAVWNHEKVE